MKKREKSKKKQIGITAILLVTFMLCTAGIVYNMIHSGQGDYAGKDLAKYINPGEYKSLQIEISAKTPEAARLEIWKYVLVNAEVIQYPERQVKAYYEKNLNEHKSLAEKRGYKTFEKYVEREFSLSVEEFQGLLEAHAKDQVKSDMLVYSIAKKEGITVSDEAYKAFVETKLKEEKLTADDIEEQYGMTQEEYAEANNYKILALQDKIVEWLIGLQNTENNKKLKK